jgi:ribonuclease HII
MKPTSNCSRGQKRRKATSCEVLMLVFPFLLGIAVDIPQAPLFFVTGFLATSGRIHPNKRQLAQIHRAKKRSKSDDVLWVEKALKKDRGFFPILGSDESGRGCVAGPVVAATCAIICDDWEDYTPIADVRDSKELLPKQREAIYDQVVASPEVYAWSVAERSNEAIDGSNILLATMECFKDSIEEVVAQLPDDHNAYSIVDGKKGPKLSIEVPSRPWVQGDKEVYSVALASILAKVSRDRMSKEWHRLYPEYGFDVHNGYATKDHVEAIHRYGPCPIHRLSFKTLKGR